MSKIVITKDRDNKAKPTKFLGVDGIWYSVDNKQQFAEVAEKIKIEYDDGVVTKLLGEKINKHEIDGTVRINVEYEFNEFMKRYI